MSLTALLLGLRHFLGLYLLPFLLVGLGILDGNMTNVRSDTRAGPIHTYDVAFIDPSMNDTGGGFIPVTTTSPLISLILISPSLALDLRNAVKVLNPECLISNGVPTAAMSWKDRYGKIYASWKIEEVIGNDPSGSFDSVVEIDSRRASRSASETSVTIQRQHSFFRRGYAPFRESSF